MWLTGAGLWEQLFTRELPTLPAGAILVDGHARRVVMRREVAMSYPDSRVVAVQAGGDLVAEFVVYCVVGVGVGHMVSLTDTADSATSIMLVILLLSYLLSRSVYRYSTNRNGR
jgi:F0F1-type ATP synthase assembly protein I